MSVITKDRLEKFLGRTLSTDDFELHIDSAVEQLEAMLGTKIGGVADQVRKYDSRRGYHSLFVDPFVGLPSVTSLDGKVVEVSSVMQGDDYNASWFNTIVMRDLLDGEPVVVRANWGYGGELPNGLASLLAAVFGVVSSAELTTTSAGAVKSETVLSHSVTYDTTKETKAQLDQIVSKNASLIAKYSQPSAGAVRHGGCR